jgi:hypothetical protein
MKIRQLINFVERTNTRTNGGYKGFMIYSPVPCNKGTKEVRYNEDSQKLTENTRTDLYAVLNRYLNINRLQLLHVTAYLFPNCRCS